MRPPLPFAFILALTGAAPASAPPAARAPPTPAARPRPGPAAPSAVARAVAEDAPLPVAMAPPPAPSPDTRSAVIAGPMEDVLYGSRRADLDAEAVAAALSLFAHKLDFTRDIALGDRIRLLVRRRPAGGSVLDYAEWRGQGGSVRFYRRRDGDRFAAGDFTDETGGDVDRLFLRTPLESRRVTSGFGLRLHPVLGYSRLHQGVDFAAAAGTPVLAAGDGVVGSAGWAGGYGRRIVLVHTGGFSTVYAHLSAFSPRLPVGAAVRQGQVIGWTGASGLVTGPHLHFEVRQAGRPVDPRLARLPGPPPDPAAQAAFALRRQAIDARLSAGA